MRYWQKLIREKIWIAKIDWTLWKRRKSIEWAKFKHYIQANLYGDKDDLMNSGIDLAVVIAAAFAGLLLGGFLGLIFVINALWGV